MRPGSKLPLPMAAAAASLLLLAGCVDSPEPAPQPTSSETATPTPTPTPTAGEPSPSPTPSAQPLVLDCVSLVPADAFTTLFKTFTLVPDYAPPPGSPFAEVLDREGTVCGWTAADGTIVTIGVADLGPDGVDTKANELVVSSHSVPTYGVEAYFQVASGVGEVQAFSGPYWIMAVSTAFMEPGEVAPIMTAVLERLE